MFANMSGWHLLIILAVVLLLFGATRLPPSRAASVSPSASSARRPRTSARTATRPRPSPIQARRHRYSRTARALQ